MVETLIEQSPDTKAEARLRLGFSARLWQEALEECGWDAAQVVAQYERWKRELLSKAEAAGWMSTRQFADLLGSSTDYVAQLKIRGMVTWSGRRSLKRDWASAVPEEAEEGEIAGEGRGFLFAAQDVERLILLSETWLTGGSDQNGGGGTRGPLAHLFVRWLRLHGSDN